MIDVPNLFRMHGQTTPAPDVLALRQSRIALLVRLIEFGMQLVRGLRLDPGAPRRSLCALAADFARISRWLRVAIFLRVRIAQGALDSPREPRKARTRGPAADLAEAAREAFEAFDAFEAFRPEHEAVRRAPRENLERYLERPFGEVVGLICRGIGLRPDWDAWACEPWAQEEIRTRPPASPYADYPGPGPGPSREPPPGPPYRNPHPPSSSRAAAAQRPRTRDPGTTTAADR
jgi:hypothetical protein